MPFVTVPSVLMRGGTSKGVFFAADDVPGPGPARDQLLLAALGSPDAYGKQLDGLGGATSSTSKAVIIAPSARPDCDVDYLFAHIAIREGIVDYSGNCGNLSAAVGIYALERGLVKNSRAPVAVVRVWQANLQQRFLLHVPLDAEGRVSLDGDYTIAGVSGSGPRIAVEFLHPMLPGFTSVLPTGQVCDELALPDGTRVTASLIAAGNATVFVTPAALGLRGNELPGAVTTQQALLNRVEAIRIAGALRMGLATDVSAAHARPATPKLAMVSPPCDYRSTADAQVNAAAMDICIRIFSMGVLHHALTATGAVAAAVAARIPGTLVQQASGNLPSAAIRLGHCAGTMEVEARVSASGLPIAHSATLYRTARTLMRGEICVRVG